MPKVVTRGESVYQCNVCNRKTRVPTNRRGLDVLHNCTITEGCKGSLNKVLLTKDIINTPTLTPSVTGIRDWFQRKVLYTHEQVIASKVWNITHNLNSNPVIHTFLNQMIDGETQLVPVDQPNTNIIDSNNIQVLFESAESGVAQLVALSSENRTNPFNLISPTISVDNIQISTDTGVLTVATLSSLPIIGITITFVIPGQAPVTITYTNIDNTPSTTSPWAGTQELFINGNTYTVRSINIITHPNAINFFLSGQIPPQGCSLYVNAIQSTIPEHEDILILTANSPYTPIDRIYDKAIDLGDETANSNGVLYSFGKIYSTPTVLKSIYPYIIVV